MSSGISNRSRWLPRFIPNVLPVLDGGLFLLNQRSEQPARGDHSSPENSRYSASRMHRSPDPPQPRTSTVVVAGPVQRPTPPEGTRRPVERSARAPPGTEVRGVEDLVLSKVLRSRTRQACSEGDALDLAPYERILQPVLPPVGWRREQYSQRPSVVRVDLARTIVVDEGHRLPRLLTGLEARVECAGVGRQHDAVRRDRGWQLFPECRVHGHP